MDAGRLESLQPPSHAEAGDFLPGPLGHVPPAHPALLRGGRCGGGWTEARLPRLQT